MLPLLDSLSPEKSNRTDTTTPPGAFPGEYVATQLGPGSAFYTDDSFFELSKERIFARTWQFLGRAADVGTGTATLCGRGPRPHSP